MNMRALFVVCLLTSLTNNASTTVRAFAPLQTVLSIRSPPTMEQNLKAQSTSKERQPWDVLRFLKQSSKFVTLPNPFQRPRDTKLVRPGDVLWQAGGPSTLALSSSSSSRNDNVLFQWAPLDDVVMGGVSSSTVDNETGLWTGVVSEVNSGGFVGIRSTPFTSPLNMEACNGVEFRLRGGNGNRFKAVVRDSTDFNGICWTTSFDAPRNNSKKNTSFFNKKDTETGDKGATSVKLPFAKQIPTLFAKTVPGQSFRKDNVVGLQLAYSKFEYDGDLNPNFELGDFSLQIVEVRAY